MQTVCMFNVCLCFLTKCSLLLNNKKFTKTSFANFEAFRISLSAVASFVILNSPRDVVHRETNGSNLSFLKTYFLVTNINLEEKQDMIRWATFIWNQSPLSFTCELFFSNSHVHDLVRATKGFQNHATIMLERVTFLLAISPLLRTNNLTSKREHLTKK